MWINDLSIRLEHRRNWPPGDGTGPLERVCLLCSECRRPGAHAARSATRRSAPPLAAGELPSALRRMLSAGLVAAQRRRATR